MNLSDITKINFGSNNISAVYNGGIKLWPQATDNGLYIYFTTTSTPSITVQVGGAATDCTVEASQAKINTDAISDISIFINDYGMTEFKGFSKKVTLSKLEFSTDLLSNITLTNFAISTDDFLLTGSADTVAINCAGVDDASRIHIQAGVAKNGGTYTWSGDIMTVSYA